VVAVGAIDSCGVVQPFSSRGPTADARIKPEICARGYHTYWAKASNNGYGPASGTSLATPLIGGLVALLKEAHPTWNGAQLRAAIIGTGQAGADNRSVTGSPGDWSLGFRIHPEPPHDLAVPATSRALFFVTGSPSLEPVAGGDSGIASTACSGRLAFSSPDTVQVGTQFTFATVLAGNDALVAGGSGGNLGPCAGA
jgi:subtilisin family serine protease